MTSRTLFVDPRQLTTTRNYSRPLLAQRERPIHTIESVPEAKFPNAQPNLGVQEGEFNVPTRGGDLIRA